MRATVKFHKNRFKQMNNNILREPYPWLNQVSIIYIIYATFLMISLLVLLNAIGMKMLSLYAKWMFPNAVKASCFAN